MATLAFWRSNLKKSFVYKKDSENYLEMALQCNWGESINEYEVLNLLGKGGFASVYKARCLKSEKYVAIKMIDKSLIHGSAMANRVRQEVEIHSRLKHPSVLELYTFFQDTNYVYLVLELAQNGELQRYMKETMRRTMTEFEAATILQQVVTGLLYLHSHNIMHRDISLSNLLLSKDLHIKIADFGLATQLKQPNERHVTMCGTPNFISPEVVCRTSHGLPADVWGLGCMFFTLLVGHPPFDTDAVQSTLNRVVMSDYHIPSGVSYEARDLIGKLLKKNPNERISLEQVLQHPFMSRFSLTPVVHNYSNALLRESRTISSCDSGIVTFASSTASSAGTPLSHTQEKGNISSETHESRLFEGYKVRQILDKPKEANKFKLHVKSDWMMKNSKASECNSNRENSTSNTALNPEEHIYPINVKAYCNEAMTRRKDHVISHISVPPLNTARLQPTRYKTKSAIMTILKQGEVVVEFIKYRSKYNSDRVTDICWISGDGYRIVVYHCDSGRGLDIGENAPEMPQIISPECIFSYNNLPPKHWKKYVYAARFVSLVKSKTPKITYFSPKAKCALMESMEDFECCFYDGSKVTISSNDVLKVYDGLGRQLNIDVEYQKAQSLLEHQKTCLEHCMSLNEALESIASMSVHNCFPVVIGRRPNNDIQSQLLTNHKPASNSNIQFHSSTPKYKNSSTNFSTCNAPCSTLENIMEYQHRNQQIVAAIQNVPIKKVNVPGVGVAIELSHGAIQLQLDDNSIITVIPSAQGGGITYTQSSGVSTHFGPHDDLPLQVRDKISFLPSIERMLKQCRVLQNHEIEFKLPQLHLNSQPASTPKSSFPNSLKLYR